MLNTIRTTVGFVQSWIQRRLPFASRRPSLADIYNYLPVEGLFPTSGQPDESELELICDAGYQAVVNLAPSSLLENSVVLEEEILGANGVEYIHIPVDFGAPTDSDFQRFCEALDRVDRDKVWVHCAANMRVSAFVYRYRVSVLNDDEKTAKADLDKIWEPFGVWKKFIEGST